MKLRLDRISKYHKLAIYLITVSILFLASYGSLKYPGQLSVYILFTLISNFLLYLGFKNNAIFFDTFIGVFFWLGFWLKLTIRVAFFDGVFFEHVGNFDQSGVAFDRGILVATCGMSGLLLVSLIRRKLFFNYPNQIEGLSHKNLFNVYKRYRKIILVLFVLLFVFIAISNALLGIYQKGSIAQTTLPFGLNGVYKWLLLFGLASFSALILRFEFEINKKTSSLIMSLSLIESFVTNVSLLSRGMILNAVALLYGVMVSLKLNAIKSRLSFFVTSFLIFIMLFASSVLLVNYLRKTLYSDSLSSSDVESRIQRVYSISLSSSDAESRLQGVYSMTTPLFIDRWVGMEGVMAVSSYPNLGWELWKTALKENYNENETSFFDNNFIESSYVNTDKSKHHFISLPGVVAFFFYPGSFWFLFCGMFMLGGLAAMIEFSVYRLGGENVILCSLLAQVVAYRLTSFGYVPAQSYLLLGALFLNLLLIYFSEKCIGFYKNTLG
jgi:hypothetical protein